MKCSDVLNIIESFANSSLKEEWDNVGLLVGSGNEEITKILVALDLTDAVIDEATREKAQLIVTHHPIMLSPLKKIGDSGDGAKVTKLIKNGICHIAAHTNLDNASGGVNDALAKAIGLSNIRSFDGAMGRIGTIEPMPFIDFVKTVSEELSSPHLKYVGHETDVVTSVGVCGGSGGDFTEAFKEEGADVFVTADVKYHISQYAAENNIKIIDAGHFETESCIVDVLLNLLSEKLGGAVEVLKSSVHKKSFWSYL